MHRISRLPLGLLSLLICVDSLHAQGTHAQSITLLAPALNIPIHSAPFQILSAFLIQLACNPCPGWTGTLRGRILTVTGPGTITVSAAQAGNSVFAPASTQLVLHAVAVVPDLQLSPTTITYGTAFNSGTLKAAAMAAPAANLAADAATLQSQLATSLLGVSGPRCIFPTHPRSGTKTTS